MRLAGSSILWQGRCAAAGCYMCIHEWCTHIEWQARAMGLYEMVIFRMDNADPLNLHRHGQAALPECCYVMIKRDEAPALPR